MEITVINSHSKGLIMQDNRLIKKYLYEFKGDEEELCDLKIKINMNRIGIPIQIQREIDQFIEDVLEPMIKEYDKVLEHYYNSASINDSGRKSYTESEKLEFAILVSEIISKVENQWDKFAMKKLYPYLIL